ncbi:hypothetical protein Ancab_040046 [Ancistrocladus abbreviatus]
MEYPMVQKMIQTKKEVLQIHIKCNHNHKKVGLGFVIRDSSGMVYACGCHTINIRSTSIILETMALRFAVLEVQNWGFVPLKLETDALHYVIEWRQEAFFNNELSLILSDIKETATRLRIESLSYCPREANCVAYRIAKLAVSFPSDVLWGNYLPVAITDSVLRDIKSLG